jgi:WD40 repeat protein
MKKPHCVINTQPMEKNYLTGGGDGTACIMDTDKGDTLFTIKSYDQPVFDVHFQQR